MLVNPNKGTEIDCSSFICITSPPLSTSRFQANHSYSPTVQLFWRIQLMKVKLTLRWGIWMKPIIGWDHSFTVRITETTTEDVRRQRQLRKIFLWTNYEMKELWKNILWTLLCLKIVIKKQEMSLQVEISWGLSSVLGWLSTAKSSRTSSGPV